MSTAPARWVSRALARWACCALVATGAPAARAQEATLETSAALRCLSPPPEQRGEPEYPFDAWKASAAGRVKVALVFNGPDLAPEVDVLQREGPDEHVRRFVDAVREHVATLRVPCVAEIGGQARLDIVYVFRPDMRRVEWSRPVDAADPGRALMLRCVVHVDREEKPPFPVWAQRAGVQGRVLARMRFHAKDRPPEVQVYARSMAGELKRVVADWAEELRMPCHEGAPIESVWTYVYRFRDDAAYGFRAITLPQLLGAVRGLRRLTLQLDPNTMGCPFELRLAYRQPDLPNLVGEVGGIDPARRPLLDWLATVDLDLPQRTLDAVYGDTARLQVPCVKIDLKPKE